MPSPNANSIARPADHAHASLGGSYRRNPALAIVTDALTGREIETVECPDCAGQRAHCQCCGLPVEWCEREPGEELVRDMCTCCDGMGEIDVCV
jgi:hypothetical protein